MNEPPGGSQGRLRLDLLAYSDFDVPTLYAVLAARAQVFVVEQRSTYLDPDGKDPRALHLLAREQDRLVGYLRILPAGVAFAEYAIGRVLVVPEARGKGLARALVREALDILHEGHGSVDVRLTAQTQLVDFYRSFGFETTGAVFEDGGVPHVDMLRQAP